ncbi:Mannan endo-1%2C4-beta-mannosidase [uncultured Bacteroides sp.]|uniref:glycosyl hydrolase n=1 Tax=Bacteroides cellulolyticus TaxID=2981780 RepID=UPI000820C20D|nr:glycosyl hydrolase [Bacteroides cellulolyticus]MCU6772646.1 glycosyl hydrolase [Bacteroides cellulolyticus]SCI50955.1 Mannan endo-1%2C4-beta-mannosidase [uncultured Bacteroides sp.]
MKRHYLLVMVLCSMFFIASCAETPFESFPDDSKEEEEEVVTPPDADDQEDTLHEWDNEKLVTELEAEDGLLQNAISEKSINGYSGTGYVAGLWNSEASITVKFNVPERALYRLYIRYSTVGGNSHNLIVNDQLSELCQLAFPVSEGFELRDMGKYILEKGENSITFKAGWGDVYIDKFIIYTALRNEYSISETLVNPNADESARSLYAYLLNNFGKKIISGYLEGRTVANVTDCRPMLYGWDLTSYTEGYPYNWSNEANNGQGGHVFGSVDSKVIESALEWYKTTQSQGIVTLHWHWCSPTGGKPGTNTFYTEFTDFDVSKAVEDGTEENKLILRDIDAVASKLKKLQEAGVPVLFRPLHEAGGGWFWWGAKGAEPCKKLWNLLYDRLTNVHEINNLIWVWSSNEEEWYPGNDKVDIVGYDSYPGDFNVGVQNYMFNELYNLTGGKKIIAMTENGPLPDPDKCFLQDAPWALFMGWGDLLYEQNHSSHIVDVFHNKNVLTVKY